MGKAKPFIKWVGGKSQLIEQLDAQLPANFEVTFEHARGNTLFYFGPPYRPLSDTSSFNYYAKEAFNDDAQVRLKEYCDQINEAGFHFMLSNSDCKGKNENDNFFDVLYGAYQIERVWASRSINSNPEKRGKLTEILVHNYQNTKHNYQTSLLQFVANKNVQTYKMTVNQ